MRKRVNSHQLALRYTASLSMVVPKHHTPQKSLYQHSGYILVTNLSSTLKKSPMSELAIPPQFS